MILSSLFLYGSTIEFSSCAGSGKFIVAVHKVVIANTFGRCQKACRIYRAGFGNEHTVWIDQKYLPVCLHHTVYCRLGVAEYSIERNTRYAWLVKIDNFVFSYTKAIPVYYRFIACLIDICSGARLVDCSASRYYATALRGAATPSIGISTPDESIAVSTIETLPFFRILKVFRIADILNGI